MHLNTYHIKERWTMLYMYNLLTKCHMKFGMAINKSYVYHNKNSRDNHVHVHVTEHWRTPYFQHIVICILHATTKNNGKMNVHVMTPQENDINSNRISITFSKLLDKRYAFIPQHTRIENPFSCKSIITLTHSEKYTVQNMYVHLHKSPAQNTLYYYYWP